MSVGNFLKFFMIIIIDGLLPKQPSIVICRKNLSRVAIFEASLGTRRTIKSDTKGYPCV